MDNPTANDKASKFPPELLARYEQAIAEAAEIRRKNPVILGPPKTYPVASHNRPRLAPLVDRLNPSMLVHRQENSVTVPFSDIEKTQASANPNTTMVENDKLTVEGYEAFYRLVKDNPELRKEAEVEAFANSLDSLAKACGCVHTAIKQAAMGMYGQMLPIIQARNPKFFDLIKEANKVKTISFKEGTLVLLDV